MIPGVVSLFELMQRYKIEQLCSTLQCCEMFMRDCRTAEALHKPIDDSYAGIIAGVVGALEAIVRSCESDESLLAQFGAFIASVNRNERRPSVLEAQLRQLLTGVDALLKSRLFTFVPQGQAAYYMNLEQFGDSCSMFPSALGDMIEAANCFAAGRFTACIFHSMRVAEHGLRWLATQLKVDLRENNKECPVEYATWEKVLTAIENLRRDVRKEGKSASLEEKTIEYAGLADHCSHFKDMWRNPTMHSRVLYSQAEAEGAMQRVAQFMNLIAGSSYSNPVDDEVVASMRGIVQGLRELGQ